MWVDVRTFRFKWIDGSAARYGVDGKRVLVTSVPSKRFLMISKDEPSAISGHWDTTRNSTSPSTSTSTMLAVTPLYAPYPSSRELRNYIVRLRHAPTFCITPRARTLACRRCQTSGWYFPSHCC